MRRGCITIDPDLAEEFKKFACNKHGTLHGCMKAEAEEAILNHMKAEAGSENSEH